MRLISSDCIVLPTSSSQATDSWGKRKLYISHMSRNKEWMGEDEEGKLWFTNQANKPEDIKKDLWV